MCGCEKIIHGWCNQLTTNKFQHSLKLQVLTDMSLVHLLDWTWGHQQEHIYHTWSAALLATAHGNVESQCQLVHVDDVIPGLSVPVTTCECVVTTQVRHWAWPTSHCSRDSIGIVIALCHCSPDCANFPITAVLLPPSVSPTLEFST